MAKSKTNNIVKPASELFDDEVKLNNKYNAYEMLGIKDPLTNISYISKKYTSLKTNLEREISTANKQDAALYQSVIRDYDIAFQILSDPAARRKNDLHNGYGEEYLRDRTMPEMYPGMKAALDKRSGVVKPQPGMKSVRDNSIYSQISTSSDITDSESSGKSTGRSSPVSPGGERDNTRESLGQSSPVPTTTSSSKFDLAQNPTKRRTVGPRNTKVVSPPTDYEKDAGKTRIKFKDANGKQVDPLVLAAIEKERSFFTKIKMSIHHEGFLTEKETRAVEALDKTGNKDETSVKNALKAAIKPKGWGR